MEIVAKPKPVCSWQILRDCVAPEREILLELGIKERNETKTIHCACQQNCIDSVIFVNQYNALQDTNELLGTIGAIAYMRDYPLVRYKRKILFSLTDLFGKIYIYVLQKMNFKLLKNC